MNVNLRPPTPEDVRKLSVLYKQVYIQTYGTQGVSQEFADFITEQFSEEKTRAKLDSPGHLLLLAEFKNNPVGVLEVVFGKSDPLSGRVCPEIHKLYVLERFCHLGIGSQLLQMAEERLKALGHQQIWLWVLATNDRAVHFYEKHRYDWIGNSYYQMSENRYENKVMTKAL